MEITITGRHVEMTPALKDYAQERADKLLRYFDGITKIAVTLSADSDRLTAEMVISARKNLTLIGEVEHRDLYAAIDIVTDKMERQLTKQKEKIKSHRGRQPLNQVAAAAEEVDEEFDDVDDDLEDTEVSDELPEDSP